MLLYYTQSVSWFETYQRSVRLHPSFTNIWVYWTKGPYRNIFLWIMCQSHRCRSFPSGLKFYKSRHFEYNSTTGTYFYKKWALLLCVLVKTSFVHRTHWPANPKWRMTPQVILSWCKYNRYLPPCPYCKLLRSAFSVWTIRLSNLKKGTFLKLSNT